MGNSETDPALGLMESRDRHNYKLQKVLRKEQISFGEREQLIGPGEAPLCINWQDDE